MSEEQQDPIGGRVARLLGYYGVLVQGGSLAPDRHTVDEIEGIAADDAALRAERDALAKRVEELEEALPLVRMGLEVLTRGREGDVDGWDIQDLAERLGVTQCVEVGPGRYCGEGEGQCACAEMESDYCYRETEATAAIRRALAGRKGEE